MAINFAAPVSFLGMGLNLTLPADGDLLSSYRGPGLDDEPRIANLVSRLPVLLPEGPGALNVDNLAEYARNRKIRFRPNSPANPSYIKINGYRFDVISHIGSGVSGTVCEIAGEDGVHLVLKMQILESKNDIVYIVREAINNFIWSREYPAVCNTIHRILIKERIAGRKRRVYFILEKLNLTIANEIQGVGNPAALPADFVAIPGFSPREIMIGTGMKARLCTLARGLELIYDNLQGNHGDLHCNNLMDGKIIDYGYSRMVKNVGGREFTINCYSRYNNRASRSRDLTYLVWNLWHYCDGHSSSARGILQSFLNFPNPATRVYQTFQHWGLRFEDQPSHRIRKHGTRLDDYPYDLDVLYTILNTYENPNCTFMTVQRDTCPPAAPAAVAVAVAAIGGRRSRKNQKKARRTTRQKKVKSTCYS